MPRVNIQSRDYRLVQEKNCGTAWSGREAVACLVIKAVDGDDGGAPLGQRAGLVEEHSAHAGGALHCVGALDQDPVRRCNARAHLWKRNSTFGNHNQRLVLQVGVDRVTILIMIPCVAAMPLPTCGVTWPADRQWMR